VSEVTQTIMVGDGSGREGNCLQAAVASLLDLPLDNVPHFLESPDFENTMVTFAAQHGYKIRYSWTTPPEFGLAHGPSPRGVSHAVVYRDSEFAWDPHPDRSGLLRATQFVHFERSGPPS
jgi:hypothetical protein